jgi:predicted regulator of Ras-like GTPase activity (Roadblock/LC7/MglB family)
MLPKAVFKNNISEFLNEIRSWYIKLSGRGIIHGIMCADQDAKIVAVNSLFDQKYNVWDIAALGAAVYGVSKQGIDCFGADLLERGALVYGNLQFFVRSIGSFELDEKGKRELLIIVLADKSVNQGLMILQMNKFADMIREKIAENPEIKNTMKYNELELSKHIQQIKQLIINSG